MNPNCPTTRHFATKVLALAAIVCGAIVVTDSVGAATSTEVDVMAWLDDVSPAIAVDHSTDCMAGATDAVAYRNDRIVVRTNASNNSVTTVVNNTLHGLYGNGIDYAGPIERITFPTPPGGPAIVPVLSVPLHPRGGGLQHNILGLARNLRNDSAKIASPDYAQTSDGPYTHYFPFGYPEKTTSLTPPRANLTSGGLKIGSGVQVMVTDTGLFALDPINLPTTTKLSNADNDLVRIAGRIEQAGGGSSLSQLLSQIEERLAPSPGAASKLWTVVADTLGNTLPAAMSWRFDLPLAESSLLFFEAARVPAFRPPLPSGISAVRFVSDFGQALPSSLDALRASVGLGGAALLPS